MPVLPTVGDVGRRPIDVGMLFGKVDVQRCPFFGVEAARLDALAAAPSQRPLLKTTTGLPSIAASGCCILGYR